MTEKLPNVEAYQPPAHLPVDAAEPPVDAPIEAYQPPPAPAVLPPRPARKRGRHLLLGAAIAVLLGVGAVGVAAQGGPPEPAAVQADVVAVPDAPDVAEAPEAAEALEAAEAPDPPEAPGAADVPAPPPPAGGRLDLPPLPGSAEKDVRSATDGGPTSIRFVNNSGATVTVHWLDYDHNRVRYTDVGVGQGYDQATFAGHAWVVTRADGTATAVFQAAAQPARAVLR